MAERDDADKVHEQSKYLDGDVQHTPRVKGLDYSLLEKVRNELSAKKEQLADAQAESALDDALERIGEERMELDTEPRPAEEQEKVVFQSIMAKNIYQLVVPHGDENNKKNDLFAPGRMAFVFELTDEVGHYNDPFAIPTAIIRSKAEMQSVARQRGDMDPQTQVVIQKIGNIMKGQRKEEEKKAEAAKKKAAEESAPAAVVDPFDGDIFADVGRDYVLDEKAIERKEETSDKGKAKSVDYFKDLDTRVVEEEEKERDDAKKKEEEVANLLSRATKEAEESEVQAPSLLPSKRGRAPYEEFDPDANDIEMYGLGASALPTSFEERQRMVYTSDDEDNRGAGTSLVDQGTHRNKKAQLTRWDFDNEEDWQKYKDSVEIHPKSAFQFGVKVGDGRKRNREQRRGLSEKQKFNREYQMIKNIMEKKYGTKPA